LRVKLLSPKFFIMNQLSDKELIKNSTLFHDIVADFFAGSGVVANACINLGLDFISCEIDDNFHSIAVDRVKRAVGNVGLFE